MERRTGLSHYLLTVLYDFRGHSLQDTTTESEVVTTPMKKRRHTFTHIVCNNAEVARVTSDSETRVLVKQRDAQLKQQALSAKEKDWRLVHEFLGWAQTHDGHFVYVYFTGADRRRPENWKLVSKDHLSLFHSRIGRDTSAFWHMSSSDVTETDDGRHNLALDARLLVNKWLKANAHHRTLLREAAPLFARAPVDYVVTLHRQRALRLDETMEVCHADDGGCRVTTESVEEALEYKK